MSVRSQMLLGAFAASLSLSSLVLLLRGAPAAALSLDPPALDFGRIEQGVRRAIKFRVTNNSSSSITIVDVRTQCGCVVVSPDRNIDLAPAQSTEITANWNTSSRRGATFQKLIIVGHDSQGAEYYATFAFTANVQPDFDYSPEQLLFENNEVEQRKLVISGNRVSKVGLIKAKTSTQAFTATVAESPDQGMIEIIVSRDLAHEIRPRSSPVLDLYFDSPGQPHLRIPIRSGEDSAP